MSTLPNLNDLKIISIEEIKVFLEYLKKDGKEDPENAHFIEDQIKSLVITEIALGQITTHEMMEKCQLLLEFEKLQFPRWYA